MGRGRQAGNVPSIVVLVTCPTRTVARRVGNALVKRRLAACVNIVPSIESIFVWQGKVDHARECLLLIKTPAGTFAPLARAVRLLHPYEVPEIIALPISAGHPPYLRWIKDSTR